MKRIAAPMVGGMVTSTVLTLVVFPAIFVLWRGRGCAQAGSAGARGAAPRGCTGGWRLGCSERGPRPMTYTCPMHPEVVRKRARAAARTAAWRWSRARRRRGGQEPGIGDMTRRFWVSLVLTCPVFVDGDGQTCCRSHASDAASHGGVLQWLELALATPVVLWGGWPFFERGWASVVNRSLNMFTLIALGVGRGVRLQRGRDAAARSFPAVVPRRTRAGAGLLRGGGGHHDAGAARAGAGAARAQPDRRARSRAAGTCARRRRAWSRDDGSEEDVPLEQVAARATGCASGPARRCRWTAWCSKARARVDESMVTGEPIRWKRRRATR